RKSSQKAKGKWQMAKVWRVHSGCRWDSKFGDHSRLEGRTITLKINLHGYLDLPLRIHRRPDDPHARSADGRVRQTQVRVIEQVERLSPDLQAIALAEMEIAGEA